MLDVARSTVVLTELTAEQLTALQKALKANPRLQGCQYFTHFLTHREDGTIYYGEARLKKPDGTKEVCPFYFVGSQCILKMPPNVERLPYRLPELTAAVAAGWLIIIVEGPKDADNLNAKLRAAGIRAFATTNDGGARKWKFASQSRYCKGAHILLLPDKNKAGREHIEIAAASLKEAGAASIHKVDLPVGEDKDVSDFLADGGAVETIIALYEAAPEYEPPTKQSPVSFPRTVAPVKIAPTSRAQRWAQDELTRKADEVAHLTDGRHTATNAAAFYLSTIAAHGLLTESECESALYSAADSNGSFSRYKPSWFKDEFESGFNDGKLQPCDLRNMSDGVKYGDDSRYALPTGENFLTVEKHPHAIAITPCNETTPRNFHEVDTLPSLADELATIGIKRNPHYLTTWGKAYQDAIRDIFGSRARAINRLLTTAIDHADYGTGEPFTPAELVASCEGLPFQTITRAIDTLRVFTSALLDIDDLIYIPQSGSKSRRGRKSQYRLTVLSKPQIDAALIRLYRQHLYMRLCKLAGIDPLTVYQDILQGLPEYPVDDLPELFTDVQRVLWAALDPAIDRKHKSIMREVENKIVAFRKKLDTDGQVTAERDTRAVVAAAIERLTDPATRLSASGAIALSDVAEQAGVSIDTVTRHSVTLGWRRVPVIKWSDQPLAKSNDLPKPFTCSKRYRGAFVAVRVERPNGSEYGTASAGKGNLRSFVHGMITKGYKVYVGYRTASIWKQEADLTADDRDLIEKYNRQAEPPEPTESAPTPADKQAAVELPTDAPKTPALPRLMRDKMRARDNTARLSDALRQLLKPEFSDTPTRARTGVFPEFPDTPTRAHAETETLQNPTHHTHAMEDASIDGNDASNSQNLTYLHARETLQNLTHDHARVNPIGFHDDPLLSGLVDDCGHGVITIDAHPGMALWQAYQALSSYLAQCDYYDGLTIAQRGQLFDYKHLLAKVA